MRYDGRDVVPAKFDIPILPLDYVPRPQLVARLQNMVRQRVTCVVAPMGYGKTCLLAEFSENILRGGGRALWLSLDEGDAQPERLWRHVAALLEMDLGNAPRWDECAASLREGGFRISPAASMPTAASDFAAKGFRSGAVEFASLGVDAESAAAQLRSKAPAAIGSILIIDGFEHVCETPSADDFLRFAESLPPRFNLVIAARHIPHHLAQRFSSLGGFSLSDYDLALTVDEAAELMSRSAKVAGVDGDDASEQDASLIAEGWPQGVAMAARTLVDHVRGGASLRFGGSNVYVDAYFRENVEKPLSAQLFSQLVSLSAFERFSDGLIEYAFDKRDSADVIQQAMGLGLPIVRCDTSGSWFRFNELFADWLRRRLVDNVVSEQCLLASIWLDKRRRSAEAAKYMLMAVDYGYVENLVEAIYGLHRDHRRNAFILWLSRKPSEGFVDSPLMCALCAWAYNAAGYIEQSRSWEQRFEELVFGDCQSQVPKPGFLEFGSRVFASKLDAMEGKCRAALAASEPILAVGERVRPVVLSVTYQSRGEALARMGSFESASDEFIKARASAKADGTLHQVFFNLFSYADCRYRLADFESALSSCDRLIAECPSQNPFVGASHALRARMLVERGDLASARVDVDAALTLTTPHRNLDLYLEALMAKAHYEANVGDMAVAYETAYSAVVLGEQRPLPRDVLLRAYVVQALIAFGLGSGQEMEVISKRIAECLVEDDEYGMLLYGYINGLMLWQQGDLLHALEELESVFDETVRRGHKDLAIKVCAARVAVLESVGNANSLSAATLELVTMSADSGYLSSLLFMGEPLRRALRSVLASRELNARTRGYVKQVLAAFEPYFERRHERRALDAQGVNELTSREREVLELLNRGMSRKEIANALCISVNTAKHHITHIYEKLGVTSKREALDAVSQ